MNKHFKNSVVMAGGIFLFSFSSYSADTQVPVTETKISVVTDKKNPNQPLDLFTANINCVKDNHGFDAIFKDCILTTTFRDGPVEHGKIQIPPEDDQEDEAVKTFCQQQGYDKMGPQTKYELRVIQDRKRWLRKPKKSDFATDPFIAETFVMGNLDPKRVFRYEYVKRFGFLPIKSIETIHCIGYRPDVEGAIDPFSTGDAPRNRQALEGRVGEQEYNRFAHTPGTFRPLSAAEYNGQQPVYRDTQRGHVANQNRYTTVQGNRVNTQQRQSQRSRVTPAQVPIVQVPLNGRHGDEQIYDDFYVGPGD